MNNQNTHYVFGVKPSPLGTIGAILTFALLLTGVYFLIKGAYYVLGLIAPILLILTLIIDYKVVTGYLNFLWKLLKQNPIGGILGILLSVLLSPFVAGFLFAKALMKRSIKKHFGDVEERIKQRQKEENTYSDYEEIEEVEENLELPKIEKAQPIKNKNDYDDLFNN